MRKPDHFVMLMIFWDALKCAQRNFLLLLDAPSDETHARLLAPPFRPHSLA